MSTNCTIRLEREALNSKATRALFLSIIFVFALLLNVKTFLVLLKRKRQHRNMVTIFLLNLTLVSALMVLQVPFNIYAIIQHGWVFGEAFCQFNGFSNVFLCMNLIFTLLCLTIDRYLAVVKPLRHRALMTRRTAYHMLVVVYFLSFLLAIIPILGKARYKYHPGTNHCSPAWSNSCGYAATMTTVAFIVPILGMLVTYTKIFITLRSKRVLMSKNSSPTMSSKEISSYDTDSNSPGNFEDTSTDPTGDGAVVLTVHRSIVDSMESNVEYAIQPSPTEGLPEKTGTVEKFQALKITGRGKRLADNVLEVYSSIKNSAGADSIGKDTKYTVEPSGNRTGSSAEYDVKNWSSDEHLTEEHSMVKGNVNKENINTNWTDNVVTGIARTYAENKGFTTKDQVNKICIEYLDGIGTDLETVNAQDYASDHKHVAHTRVSHTHANVDSTANSLNLGLPGQQLDGRYTARRKKKILFPVVSRSSTGADICVAEEETSDTSTANIGSDLDTPVTMRIGLKVSFQNSTKVSPLKTIAKEDTNKQMSRILPISCSRKAVNFVVTRMKKQRAIRHEYKIARTGTVLVLSFLMLWMPYVVAHSCFIGQCRSLIFYNIATLLVYTNALANPIIYALTNRAVMQDIRKSFGKLCK